MEEAIFLTKFATKVDLVHRRDEFRASQIMVDRAARQREDRVRDSDGRRRGARGDDGKCRRPAARHRHRRDERARGDGLFVAIGHDPNTALFLDQLDHDEAGYLVTKPGSTETNVPGVFAAGDVQDHVYRQAVTAAGSGCMAALDAERFLAARGRAVSGDDAASAERR